MDEKIITPEEFKIKMQEIAGFNGDIEGSHGFADELLCETLERLGYSEGIDIFKDMHKWYA